jgi:hypothetical protein
MPNTRKYVYLAPWHVQFFFKKNKSLNKMVVLSASNYLSFWRL